MNTAKPAYLLAGGRGGKSQKPIFEAIFKDIGKTRPSIAYVGVASDDNWGFYLMMARMIKSAADCTVERVVLVSKKADIAKARSVLESSDAVFMSGGDVEAGIQILKDKNLTEYFVSLYDEGKLFFGASAGSIMMADKWVRWPDPNDDSSAELFPCLGIAHVLLDTHAEEDDWEELRAAVALERDNACGFGIASGSCLKVDPVGKIQALGGPVARYLRQNGKVIRQPDLLP